MLVFVLSAFVLAYSLLLCDFATINTLNGFFLFLLPVLEFAFNPVDGQLLGCL